MPKRKMVMTVAVPGNSLPLGHQWDGTAVLYPVVEPGEAPRQWGRPPLPDEPDDAPPV